MNAKMRRTGICGATETILVDNSIAGNILPELLSQLDAKGCEVRGCDKTQALFSKANAATDEDYFTEHLAPIVNVKIVADASEAIAHIAKFGSNHTDAIITEDDTAAELFFREVDSAIVVRNASTQFADGGEFGFGAEIGIATGRLHARGPVGAQHLTTYKYTVTGDGHTRP